MQSNMVRRGGIWWARLVVPTRLRAKAGRREFTQSCRTHELHIAKLVSAVLLAGWRRELLTIESVPMPLDVLKIVEGGPELAKGGYLTLKKAADAVGLSLRDLLENAAAGRLMLHCRLVGAAGHLIHPGNLEPIHPEIGRHAGLVIPQPAQMPAHAIPVSPTGIAQLADSAACARSAIADGLAELTLTAFHAPDIPELWFIPSEPLDWSVGQLEVSTVELESIRSAVASRVLPERLEHARSVRGTVPAAPPHAAGKWAGKPISWAIEEYCSRGDGLPHSLAAPQEQRQRRSGLMLFPEFMEDMKLGAIDGDALRKFRDGPLKDFPDHANRLKKPLRRNTMRETIEALKASNPGYKRMTLAQQQERMQWLFRLFAWLVKQGYLASDPALPLHGHTGMTKAERIAASRKGENDDDEGRRSFNDDELKAIFNQQHYKTGNGVHVVKANEAWRPFEYWLPLLALYSGCRIKELSQLHLSDVCDLGGTLCFDINRRTEDKSLKNDQSSVRVVPIHPRLIDLGFIGYCHRLRQEGYRRVFPELTHTNSQARYAKESGRVMSRMLARLGMKRDNTRVFHNFRKNFNGVLQRIPATALPALDEQARILMRHQVMGHDMGKDVNAKHYTSISNAEKASMVNAVNYDLPPISPFDIEGGIQSIREALARKKGDRRGKEDMGPAS